MRQSIGFEVNWIWNNCIISNIENLSIYRPQYEPRNKLTNCLFFNNSISHFDILENCTVYGGEVNLRQFGDYRFKNSIISESNVIINPLYTGDMKIVYTIFHNCTFKFTGGDQGADETTFTAPAGADDTEKLEDLRARMAVVYGGVASQYLQNCRYQTDGDLFIDPAKENFYLVPGCQAARMSYEAGYIANTRRVHWPILQADF
ncbi:hypothetical protein, partial [Marinilabilia salmonicolor]|uniref:hypothetical protein n=1 Tax=Marinilabilia salmonicolor TaxID=989 RepID=UPI00056ABE60